MSSIRVPPDLLAKLHEAAPPGTSLPALLRWLLKQAGGPTQIRQELAWSQRTTGARAQVERLRRHGHRSMRIAPHEQVALAEACVRWTDLLEEQGERRWEATDRTLELQAPARRGATGTKRRLRIERSPLP